MKELNNFTTTIFFIWNFFVFFLYGIDKSNAKNGRWRIPNKVLLACSFCLGGIGAYLGAKTFRHKTKTGNFFLYIILALGITMYLGYYFIRL
jgi:Predicted membrane protein